MKVVNTNIANDNNKIVAIFNETVFNYRLQFADIIVNDDLFIVNTLRKEGVVLKINDVVGREDNENLCIVDCKMKKKFFDKFVSVLDTIENKLLILGHKEEYDEVIEDFGGILVNSSILQDADKYTLDNLPVIYEENIKTYILQHNNKIVAIIDAEDDDEYFIDFLDCFTDDKSAIIEYLSNHNHLIEIEDGIPLFEMPETINDTAYMKYPSFYIANGTINSVLLNKTLCLLNDAYNELENIEGYEKAVEDCNESMEVVLDKNRKISNPDYFTMKKAYSFTNKKGTYAIAEEREDNYLIVYPDFNFNNELFITTYILDKYYDVEYIDEIAMSDSTSFVYIEVPKHLYKYVKGILSHQHKVCKQKKLSQKYAKACKDFDKILIEYAVANAICQQEQENK